MDSPPEGDGWLHELKYDGYRTEIIVAGDQSRAFTRTGLDWTSQYAHLVNALAELDCETAILDGEVILQGANGIPDFHGLRRELAKRRPRGLIFMAFDLLHLDGQDLRREPVEERRAKLRDLIGENTPGQPFQFSDHVIGGGSEFFAAAERMGLEGIVSKKLGSRYRSGPAKTWLKSKSFTESEFVVIGTSKGDLAPVALLARETEDHRLEYAGAAMVTFSEADRERFWRANERLKTDRPALHMDPRPETSWLKPEMRVRVRHLQGEEMLRHATVKSILRLPAEPSRSAQKKRTGGPSKEPGYHVEHGAVPDLSALLAYYREVGPLMLPHLCNRPLNLFRCHGRYCFFQRNRNHPPTEHPFDEPIHKIPVLQKNGRTEDYLFIDSLEGLLACVEAGAVEFHAWGSRVPDYERPDRIAFDLDPGEGVTFSQVRNTAFQLRRSLEAIGLKSWPLLTGGKGIHVVVPFAAEQGWNEVRAFAKSFCVALAEAAPDRFTVALPLAKRRGRIFLDYLRNQRTHTAIMPYSLRARPGSPVAAPITWDELERVETPQHYLMKDAQHLAKRAEKGSLFGRSMIDQRLPLL
ncbi:DNA ligase D [Sphingosinicella humi]|uniref:DNA ligase D n=1 Tax=Allosphingosinicella humi TaxID=2068657 RepID=UPI0013049B6E|nr:DNA ligase D [Sphingosinicella humi]